MNNALSQPQKNILASQHWIFDMDGTLTIGVHDFAMMRSELGLAPDAAILETVQAMPPEQAAPAPAATPPSSEAATAPAATEPTPDAPTEKKVVWSSAPSSYGSGSYSSRRDDY